MYKCGLKGSFMNTKECNLELLVPRPSSCPAEIFDLLEPQVAKVASIGDNSNLPLFTLES
jgi:hypothetical protein